MSISCEIKLSSIDDLSEIISFLKKEYKDNHIITRDEDLFRQEYQDEDGLNFVLAKNEEKIVGCLGFMKSNSGPRPDLWTSIWVVAKKRSDPTIGIKLFQYLRDEVNHRYLLAGGVNPETLPFYFRFGIDTGKLNQHYIINNKIEDFKIAKIKNNTIPENLDLILKGDQKIINQIKAKDSIDEEWINNLDTIPSKDSNYFKKRYFNYLHHTYFVFSVSLHSHISSIFVLREIIINNSKALIFVDLIGSLNDLSVISKYLKNKIIDENYEFVTFLEYGIPKILFEDTYFSNLNFDDNDLIIPIYFSPLIRENRHIYFFADNINEDFFIFKADGDQDRPN
tara:strand:+ start:1968 stop:2981 length:1014 start_codon:yes stop_codon:yes gene_type:complete